MDIQLLRRLIYGLENSLLQPEIRQSAVELAKIMADEFFEFCSSGSIYMLKNDGLHGMRDLTRYKCEIKDFEVKLLATDLVLATYKLIKHHETDEAQKYSLRSSIWKSLDGQWKIVFHQGTPAQKF